MNWWLDNLFKENDVKNFPFLIFIHCMSKSVFYSLYELVCILFSSKKNDILQCFKLFVFQFSFIVSKSVWYLN